MTGIDYLQSENDTPCRVTAAPERRKSPPDIMLSKWADEAYLSIRTAERCERVRDAGISSGRLCIETNKRKHIITRLDSNQIEYDVIIDEKPKSGELRLPVSFPRGIEFYKQGMNREKIEPHIKGSYALYWKHRNNKYKTGKLCHIYRPMIIDAKGRRCWGELDYDGTGLVITIPERFLKACSYPVTVDPIIGTSSVGSQHLREDGGDYYDYYYEMIMPANPYTVVDPVNGNCTAYMYSYHSDSEARGYPCLYSNSGSNPGSKLSSSEEYADLRYPNASGEWLSADFTVSGNIAAGSTVWLAYMSKYYFFPYFDNGGTAREMNVESMSTPPNTFVPGGWAPDPITISMYFSYISAQDYTRSITGSEGIADSVTRLSDSKRYHAESSTGLTSSLARSKGMSRAVAGSSTQSDSILLKKGLKRIIAGITNMTGTTARSIGIKRDLVTEGSLSTAFTSMLTKTRALADGAAAASVLNKIYTSLRKMEESPGTGDEAAGIHDSKRFKSESPAVDDDLTPHVLKRIIITGLWQIWDYITNSKVRSKVEVVLISRITDEVEINSRIG